MQKEMLQAFTQIHKIKNNFFSPLPVIMRVALVKSMFVHMLIKSIALQTGYCFVRTLLFLLPAALSVPILQYTYF